jgi:hypothetical protein
MTQPPEPTWLGAALRRQWIIIVAAVLVGLIAAGIVANAKTTKKWSATRTVTVAQVPGGIAATTTTGKAGVVVTAASTATVLRAAEASLSLKSGALNGTVSSAIATADSSSMTISVTGPTRAAAIARAEAVTKAAVDSVLSPYQGYFALQESQAQSSDAQAQALAAQIASLQKTAASVPSAQRAGYYQALVDAEGQRYAAVNDALTARQRVQTIQSSVYVNPDPKVSRVSSRLRLATLAQGLLLGIVAGVCIAGLREWLRTREKAA